MVSVENINQGILEKVIEKKRFLLAKIDGLIFPVKEGTKKPENIDYLKSFWAGTGIVEKMEGIKENRTLIYQEIERNNRRVPITELMHIDYEEGKITTTFDYRQHKDWNFFRKISIETIYDQIDEIQTREKQYKISYQDLRHPDDDFEYTSKNSAEILNKIDRAVISRSCREANKNKLTEIQEKIKTI